MLSLKENVSLDQKCFFAFNNGVKQPKYYCKDLNNKPNMWMARL